ncbi:MAG TPA: type 1 periplasmic binding fold superfamily protein, partial [Flavobacterium sp.]|nr:type 1 periplasmic binding fold superfamily protein [Flavobacterium sp.]
MKNLKLALVAAIISASCTNDDTKTVVVNEEEVITTVRIILDGGGETIILESRDLDGDGPNAPIITPVSGGALIAGTTYTGSVRFLNELVKPAEDITVEVEEEGDNHQVFYQLPSSVGTISYDDLDINDKPIGLNFTLVTNATAATGNLMVT